MDLETRIYKYSLMIGGALLTVLFLLCTIFCTFMGPGIGWGALMFVSMLISIGVFYIGWDTGRNRPKEQNLKAKTNAEYLEELS
ncbi:hypothetical protein [Rothia dentocariosa]|uniref:hypothetical protein n=1 Tax=Rothia dentocariosa TaxID=2047 RepID=UPI00065FFA39|nr:hypothetical protein [Rothia dentocariosa]